MGKKNKMTREPLTVVLLISLMCGVLSQALADESAAWTEIGKYYVFQAKEGIWESSWIGPGKGIRSDDVGKVFYVRKTFETDDPSAFKRVYVSADSKYKMWVNGQPVARGPARFDPDHQIYDTLDISSLIQPGKNVIAAEVMYWGWGGPIFQISLQPGFVFESKGLKSDASWKVLVCPGIESAGDAALLKWIGYLAGNWMEKVDARYTPVGWQALAYDDERWDNAENLGHPSIWGERDTHSPWKLIPRTIPPLEERAEETCKVVQSGLVVDDKENPPFQFDVKADAEAPSLPFVAPGDGKIHYVVFDAGRLVTAYPRLEVESAGGAIVEIKYGEAPILNGKKGRRDRLEDKRVEGYNDIYITQHGRQVYEPFLHRTFWYVRVAVKSDTPVTIHGLNYRWTSYAFPERGAFTCSDPLLNQIWEVGRYTARLCAHESYEDCPYYEQLQYAGDTRIQMLVTYYAFGDPRLPALGLRHLNISRIPEGLTQSRYPAHMYQVIPGFSLFWVMMIEDYYLHTGDLELVREMTGGIYSVLRFFEDYQTDKGFLANLPYWNYHDWAFRRNGMPRAVNENCTISTLLYKGALDAGARLMEALDNPLEAERFHRLSKKMAAAVNANAWSEAEGLYTDGVAIRDLSQHANIYAILFDVANEERQKRIAERLFEDKKLTQATFYFSYYLHQVAEKLGQPQRILDDMIRWKNMLETGTSTWWETPEPQSVRSECHAWSSSPTYTFMKVILGVRPVEPGFARAEIRPFPAGLEWAKGTTPTPHGDIHVSWTAKPEFSLEVTLPESVKADVILPNGQKFEAGAGKSVFK
ncbi:MAG: hypothetical protein C4527_08610 [Candidatus Omnitrophota bacterium]|jgi:hypothetical protein|nr:MAG: hypothetical protein C4527_08610 [Candidatus Omnitrophota bacterium]